MAKLICIVGQKRSGKDEFASRFMETVGLPASAYALADPIKDALCKAYISKDLHIPSGQQLARSHWDGFDIYGDEIDREEPLLISNKDVVSLVNSALIDLRCKSIQLSPRNGRLDDEDIYDVIMANRSAWSIRRLMQVFGTDIVVNMIDKNYWNRLFADRYIDFEGDFFVLKDIRQGHEIDLMRKMGAIVVHICRDINKSQDQHITEQPIPVEDGDIVIENYGTLEDYHKAINDATYTILHER